MRRIVVDASAALAWLFDEHDTTPWLEQCLSSTDIAAPSLWRFEVVNAIVVKERRKQITELQGDRFLEALDGLPISIIPPSSDETLSDLARLARRYQLTSYDAAYLDLARSIGASLLTFDNNLVVAAKRMNVSVASADSLIE